MEYQKIIILLDNTPTQPSQFRINLEYWVEINDDSSGTYNTSSQTKFHGTMLK